MKRIAMLAAMTTFAWIATAPAPAEAELPKAAKNHKPGKAPIKGAGVRADQASAGRDAPAASCGDGEVMCGQGCCDTATQICGDGKCHPKESEDDSASGAARTQSAHR